MKAVAADIFTNQLFTDRRFFCFDVRLAELLDRFPESRSRTRAPTGVGVTTVNVSSSIFENKLSGRSTLQVRLDYWNPPVVISFVN